MTWLLAGHALAYHAGNLFAVAPGGGGGGGLFYTGSPREHGWTCGACHLDAPRRTRVNVTSDPPELVAGGSYTPGQAYRLSFALANEYLGLASPLSNYNSIVITALDRTGAPAGAFSGFAAAEYYMRGTSIIASAGQTPNQTSWTFDWTAPAAGAGRVQLFIAVLDGNAANSRGTATDPFGDDFALGTLTLSESAAALAPGGKPATRELGGPPPRAAPAPVVQPVPSPRTRWLLAWAAALALALATGLLWRRGRRARLVPAA